MRTLMSACFITALASGCHSAPQANAAQADTSSAVTADGKIPITTHSEQARALFLRGRALSDRLQVHAAHAAFEQAVAIDPSFAMGEYYLATTAPTANDLALHLRKALALAPNASPGERLFIELLDARSHADRSRQLQLAESLVVRYPLDERAHLALASIYSAQQRRENTIAEYQKAIAIDPGYSLAYNQLGFAYRSVNMLDSAQAVFLRYIALVPNDPNPHDSYAELLMKMGRFDESILEYRKALSIDPHFGASFIGVAADEMYSGRHKAALEEAQKYFVSARDDGERRTAMLTLAMIDVDNHATEAAVRVMERSYGIASATSDTASMSADAIAAADILLAAGRVDSASARYRRAHDLVAASSMSDAVKKDDELARHYDMARVAVGKHDVKLARLEASAYLGGATDAYNDARVRQARELNGLVALEAKEYDVSRTELALADQDNPAVIYAMSRTYAGEGNAAKARTLAAEALHTNILPSLPYVFTRAALASATGLATAGRLP